MRTYEVEGAVGGAVGSVIMLIVGVGVSVLILIFVGALGGQTYNLVEEDIDAITNYDPIVNESFTGLNYTGVSLNNVYIHESTFVLQEGATVIGAGNYSLVPITGVVTLIDAEYNGTVLNASYSYGDLSIRNSVKGGIISGFESLEQTGNYLPIIVLAIVISLVLVLVLGFTALGGGAGGRGSAL